MKKIVAFMFLATITMAGFSQNLVYNPTADAKADIQKAVAQAKAEGKNVFIQIGGNWCPWCMRFHALSDSTPAIKEVLNKNYVVVKVNYSKENKNEATLAQLDFPQRFGFPVFVILNGEGKRIHTQNSSYLEQGKGYSVEKIVDFLKGWTPAAIDPMSYEKK